MPLQIVLVEPEIPQNTGNIARTCVAIGARLHLVEPLGFSISDRAVKRAGLDYWHDLDLAVWSSLEQLWAGLNLTEADPGDQADQDIHKSLFYATTKAGWVYTRPCYPADTVLFFGPETRGLPEPLLQAHPERCLRIPMLPGCRSLNLSNAVAIMAYEVLRQQGFPGLQQAGPSDRMMD